MTNLFQCSNLTKKYTDKIALDHLNFSLPTGKIVGLLGPNGSGKTTLIKLMNGLLQPTEGELQIGGNKVGVETKRMVSYLPDCNSLPEWMRVDQLIRFYRDFYEDFSTEKARQMLQNLGVDEQATMKTLSKGNKEKVQLILAMARQARLYLLDEPMGGVDPATRDYILHTIIANYSEQSTVVISTHLIADVENILDEVIFIKDGKLVLQESVDWIRSQQGKSVDLYFREVFKC